MDIRNSLDGLKSLLGVESAAPAAQRSTRNARTEEAVLGNDSATLSSAASEVSQAASEDSVRMDKVTAVQSAIADGSYHVPASEVATKVVDAMLASRK